MKPYVASHHLDTCSWKVWRKSIQGKWQKWCVVHVTKKQRLCDQFFRALFIVIDCAVSDCEPLAETQTVTVKIGKIKIDTVISAATVAM